MRADTPFTRVPVGPKAGQASEPAPAPVTEFLVGEFSFYETRSLARDLDTPAITIRKYGLRINVSLANEIKQALGRVPDRVKIGLDNKRCLVTIEPSSTGLRFSPSKTAVSWAVTSAGVARWLKGHGVTGSFEAHWQPQTQSIVGRYPRSGVEVLVPPKPAAHQWAAAEETNESGKPLWKCDVCGYYTADVKNPLLREKPCKPELYADRYQIKDGKLYPRDNW